MLHLGTKRALLGYRSRARNGVTVTVPAPFIDLESDLGALTTDPVIAPTTNPTADVNTITGTYGATDTPTVQVATYRSVGGVRYFAESFPSIESGMTVLGGVLWGWDAVVNADGYILTRNGDASIDVGNVTTFDDDNSLWGGLITSNFPTAEFLAVWNDQAANAYVLNVASGNPLVVPNQLNGFPAIRFNGDSLTSVDTHQGLPFSLAAVLRLNAFGDQTLFSFNGQAENLAAVANVINANVFGTTNNIVAVTTNVFFRFGFVYANGTATIRINGVQVGSGAAGGTLGFRGLNFQFGGADLIAFKGYNVALTAAQLASVEAAFKTKYPALP